MSAEPNSNANVPAPEGQANPSQPSNGATPPAPGAGEDAAALKVQLDSLLKWKQSAESDLKKYRDANKAAEERATQEKAALETQLREQAKFAELARLKEEEAKALAAQLAAESADAEIARALKARKQTVVDAAKADPALPAYIKVAINSAKDVLAASEILDEFRASQASAQPAPKQPAPPAPAPGGAPPSPAPPVGHPRSVADLQKLQAADPAKFNELIRGGPQPGLAQRIGARITGVGRK